jgi:hypothetical protein
MAITEIFDGNEWQQISYVQSILYGTVSTTYTTDLTGGNHIKFDILVFQKGANITLDVLTPYTTSINIDSVGRVKLMANKTYKLTGSLNNVKALNTSPNITQWYNIDNNTPIGLISTEPTPKATTTRIPAGGAVGFITPSVDTRVELRFLDGNSILEVPGEADSNGSPWFYCEEIG